MMQPTKKGLTKQSDVMVIRHTTLAVELPPALTKRFFARSQKRKFLPTLTSHTDFILDKHRMGSFLWLSVVPDRASDTELGRTDQHTKFVQVYFVAKAKEMETVYLKKQFPSISTGKVL